MPLAEVAVDLIVDLGAGQAGLSVGTKLREDKVPILGDIPIIGRLFQSTGENRIKSNLIIFVTAQIIDATGRPLRGADAGESVPVTTGGEDFGLGVLPELPE